MDYKYLCWIFCLFIPHLAHGSRPCQRLDVGGESFVCVCNSTYCDTIDPVVTPPKGQYSVYLSTLQGERFNLTQYEMASRPSSPIVVAMNASDTYQSILGFGGAFTDAAGINILSLSGPTRDHLLRSYFSDEGIEYNVGRIPMASCDFSTHAYSYDDQEGDLTLSHFALTDEDFNLKIPIIRAAQKLKGGNLTLFGSPWSAPAWMKTNNNMTGKGSLKGQPGGPYFKAWAQYFVRFLQAYEKQGLSLWGLTAQNEPTDGNFDHFPFQAMGWTPAMQGDFIAQDLGPALEQAGYGHVKLMIMDDNRAFLPYWPENVFLRQGAKDYVSGIAIHWYEDRVVPVAALTYTHDLFPDKFILSTEASNGEFPLVRRVELGSWYRGESYARDIIEDLNHWVVGWTDWNIALDLKGGPNWVSNFLDSPIIVNKTSDSFYKQPMFYTMGHFSKFIPPGSRRLALQGKPEGDMVSIVAFLRPDKSRVFIILNRSRIDGALSFYDKEVGYLNLYYPPRSIQTVVWQT